MGKLIIDNRSGISDEDACRLVSIIVRDGRTSNNNKQYCYVTTAIVDGTHVVVSTDLNKRSDKFTIYTDLSEHH